MLPMRDRQSLEPTSTSQVAPHVALDPCTPVSEPWERTIESAQVVPAEEVNTIINGGKLEKTYLSPVRLLRDLATP